MEVIAQKNVRL